MVIFFYHTLSQLAVALSSLGRGELTHAYVFNMYINTGKILLNMNVYYIKVSFYL
jgi:hypothetical protein